ncbi:MAG TPA: hypothetical protein VNJ03_09300 [Vicinamibacterales bacterium]|nr:hypothetical protein [Vicinamibacterales bacterium]
MLNSTIRTRLTIAHCVTVLLLWTAAPALAQSDPGDLFTKGEWHLELGAHGAVETWNYNISHENMFAGAPGVTYGLGKGTVFVVNTPLYYVDQRGIDAMFLGVTWGVRGRVYRRSRFSVYLEFEVGISKADVFTPPGGTRFNYLALGAAGLTTRLSSETHLLTGIKWVHVSNNSLAGRSRNPDIEAVGPHVAILRRF